MPAERLTLQQAIDAYTRNAAWASFDEHRKGSLERDMLADLVVLSKDIFALPPAGLAEAEVAVTIFDGKVVFQRSAKPTTEALSRVARRRLIAQKAACACADATGKLRDRVLSEAALSSIAVRRDLAATARAPHRAPGPAPLPCAPRSHLSAPTHSAPVAQSDLDAFMERVLARRDENWKKLQQYILDEEERFQLTGPDGSRLYGFDRDYTWFIRRGLLHPQPAQGRRRQDRRGRRARGRRAAGSSASKRARSAREERAKDTRRASPDDPRPEPAIAPPASVEDVLKQSLEPQFVSAAYFLRFKFDPGHYALAGRERLNDRDVLRDRVLPVEALHRGPHAPEQARARRDDEIEEKMNKVSLVTLWIDPDEHQILQYTFDNIDMDFLPGRSLVRVDELKASMKMAQPFPGVWLPGHDRHALSA